MQIHYGAGEDALLDCFLYEGLTEEAARAKYFLLPRASRAGGGTSLVTYDDTACFALEKLKKQKARYPTAF